MSMKLRALAALTLGLAVAFVASALWAFGPSRGENLRLPSLGLEVREVMGYPSAQILGETCSIPGGTVLQSLYSERRGQLMRASPTYDPALKGGCRAFSVMGTTFILSRRDRAEVELAVLRGLALPVREAPLKQPVPPDWEFWDFKG